MKYALAETDTGWFLYIYLDSYKVGRHLQTFYLKFILALTRNSALTIIFCLRVYASRVSSESLVMRSRPIRMAQAKTPG